MIMMITIVMMMMMMFSLLLCDIFSLSVSLSLSLSLSCITGTTGCQCHHCSQLRPESGALGRQSGDQRLCLEVSSVCVSIVMHVVMYFVVTWGFCVVCLCLLFVVCGFSRKLYFVSFVVAAERESFVSMCLLMAASRGLRRPFRRYEFIIRFMLAGPWY